MVRKTHEFDKDGKKNEVYTLSNANGVEVDILTYGARLTRISVPDRKGDFADVLVGCKTPEDYYGENPYFGATVGRYGNRIENATFSLHGKAYTLEANDGDNCLHGGTSASFDRQIWKAEVRGEQLVMRHTSPSGAGGFPGTLFVAVSFTLTEKNELIIDYKAKSNEDTVCNLTNHAYFNLGGRDTVLDHELFVKSHKITPVDGRLIPHGEYADIDGTGYSFFPSRTIGKALNENAPLVKACNGFDFNYCIARETERNLEYFACVYDRESGRRMDCYTTLPGVQLYTANTTGGFQGKRDYVNHCALCLETQGYPNSPNCPTYPSTTLKAGEEYHEITKYKFSVC